MKSIKCGRTTYQLLDGDTIMDNGACLQLITREVRKGFHVCSPKVPKMAFAQFKKSPNVKINTDHHYGPSVTLWVYSATV